MNVCDLLLLKQERELLSDSDWKPFDYLFALQNNVISLLWRSVLLAEDLWTYDWLWLFAWSQVIFLLLDSSTTHLFFIINLIDRWSLSTEQGLLSRGPLNQVCPSKILPSYWLVFCQIDWSPNLDFLHLSLWRSVSPNFFGMSNGLPWDYPLTLLLAPTPHPAFNHLLKLWLILRIHLIQIQIMIILLNKIIILTLYDKWKIKQRHVHHQSLYRQRLSDLQRQWYNAIVFLRVDTRIILS
jgi:hypothetical protein